MPPTYFVFTLNKFDFSFSASTYVTISNAALLAKPYPTAYNDKASGGTFKATPANTKLDTNNGNTLHSFSVSTACLASSSVFLLLIINFSYVSKQSNGS